MPCACVYISIYVIYTYLTRSHLPAQVQEQFSAAPSAELNVATSSPASPEVPQGNYKQKLWGKGSVNSFILLEGEAFF